MINLFLTFLKINFLTTSGPASIGLTRQFVVPGMLSEDKFNQVFAISSGIPGSDAIQMAWQVGYCVKGFLGAIVAVIGALIPTIFLLGVVYFGMKFVSPKTLAKFFDGVNPALAVLLVSTALGIVKFNVNAQLLILILAAVMIYCKIPVYFVLIASGLIGLMI